MTKATPTTAMPPTPIASNQHRPPTPLHQPAPKSPAPHLYGPCSFPAAASAPAEAAPAPEAKRNWDAVVAEVARIRAMRPLPDDKRTRMLQLQDELMAASNSDPTAREAWANLSRIINGR